MVPVQLVAKGLSFDVGHHVKEERVRLAGIEQWEDVRMTEVGGRLDLGQEAFGSDHGGQLRLQNLQRDLALVLEVVGQVDRGHATLTKLTLDGVAAL